MADAVFRVVQAGPHVTVQDGGRAGYMRYGVPASGAMDRMALIIANRSLGQTDGAPCIEVSLGGLVLDCIAGEVSLAVAGAGFVVAVDDAIGGSWRMLTIRAGQRLTIRPGPWGSWTYLGFAGQLVSTSWLGSVATHGQSGLGGGVLVAGAMLQVAQARTLPHRVFACPVWARPRHVLHAVAGPQDRYFQREALSTFATGPFHLTGSYDRMGVRLRGPRLDLDGALAIPSAPILRGSVQVSGDGVATVLLADHQTTGGYPKIATVASSDMDAFAQCRPGQAIVFHLIDAETAVRRTRVQSAIRQRYLCQIVSP